MDYLIRRAVPGDAEEMVAVLRSIVAEKVYTAIDRPWPVEGQRSYLSSLSTREAVHVAEHDGQIIGYQTLDLWVSTIPSMAHVGQMGTFLRAEWRGRGIGKALFAATCQFARANGYGKFVIQVRSSNLGAQSFYKRMGFCECGRLGRQVRIDGQEDDEVLFELFL
jgi:L-amino acid N-acyltransferase YncA